MKQKKIDHTITYLNKTGHLDSAFTDFEKADQILCVFPLYVDGMPGQVKKFFEILEPLKGQCQSKSIIFIIHSGFQETIQSRALERYLKRFAQIMDLDLKAIVIIPASEGFRLMPDQMTKKKKIGCKWDWSSIYE